LFWLTAHLLHPDRLPAPWGCAVFQTERLSNRRPEIQHLDPLTDVHHQPHLVLDQDDCQIELLADPLDEFHQLHNLIRVDARRGFVEQQQLGFGRHRPRDLQPPL